MSSGEAELVAAARQVGDNGNVCDEVIFPEDLVHEHPEMVVLNGVDGDENHTIVRQQLPEKIQPRPHHAEPLVVALHVLAVNPMLRRKPRLEQGAVDVVVVDPAVVARVVRRIDVDAIDAARVSGE